MSDKITDAVTIARQACVDDICERIFSAAISGWSGIDSAIKASLKKDIENALAPYYIGPMS